MPGAQKDRLVPNREAIGSETKVLSNITDAEALYLAQRVNHPTRFVHSPTHTRWVNFGGSSPQRPLV